MKNVTKELKNLFLYLGVLLLVVSFTSCSDDDDIEPFEPTGFFEVDEQHFIIGNTVTLQSITVDQNSWLVAVPLGEENTTNYISDPVMLEEGVNTDVQLTLDPEAVENGDQMVLKIFGDDPNEGKMGEFDEADKDNAIAVTETIIVYTEDSNEAAFNQFDEDGDNLLDESEVANTYINDFDAWDTDDDGFLDSEEFYDVTFWNTDEDDDDLVDENEWNLGFESMFNGWIDDDFNTFDVDGDGFLDAGEWDDAFADSTWFDTYDADDDGLLTDTEWDAGLFDDWDLNDDDFVGFDEFDSYYDYVTIW